MEDSLFVGGVVSLTTIDYPGRLASVVFLQGCPWRCCYCHNKHLQKILPAESLPWEDVKALLETRKGFVEAVVFSGGEPLEQSSLGQAAKEVKEMEFKVGLHTSGSYPERLAAIVSLFDWIGFDIKESFKNYQLITNVPGSGEKARESLQVLLASGVPFEARMTLDPAIEVSDVVDTFKELSRMGVRNAALQKVRDKDGKAVEHPIFSDKLLLEDLSKYFDNFFVRD